MFLRAKFMLALLLTGLAAVAMVGGLAYVGMTTKVDTIRREMAAEHFHSAVTDYLQKYGNWRAGQEAQPFDQFMDARNGGDRPLPPDGEQRPPRGEGPRPPPPGPNGEPPFRFILA